jgi:putative transposase
MRRLPRVFVEGGLYHVYNRTSHGAGVFAEGDAGRELARLLREGLNADGHMVYAWCVMANHYHVVVRSSAVPLARTFGRVQSGFGRWRHRPLGSTGPTWQSRYKAKLVEDETYLMQLIAYVHLNPVEAGAVSDPAEHPLSGHREVLGASGGGLVNRDAVLAVYGAHEREAVRNYLSSLSATRTHGADWMHTLPGGLPWWRRQVDRPISEPDLVAWVDADGRPSREPRLRLEALAYLEAASAELGVTLQELTDRSRRQALAELRFLVVGLGIERWGQRAGQLAAVFGRRPDFVSWWARKAGSMRRSDPAWERRFDLLDERLRVRFEGTV